MKVLFPRVSDDLLDEFVGFLRSCKEEKRKLLKEKEILVMKEKGQAEILNNLNTMKWYDIDGVKLDIRDWNFQPRFKLSFEQQAQQDDFYVKVDVFQSNG